MIYTRKVGFTQRWTEESFRFKAGDKVKIVDRRKCMELDRKYVNRHDHSFMADKVVTIKVALYDWPTLAPAYTIEELEELNGIKYYWEDEYFEPIAQEV